MMDEMAEAVEPAESPGHMLKTAREASKLSEVEVADQLNWMRGYVKIVESDDYQALLSPAFARGYVKAYGKLLSLDEQALMASFATLPDPSSGSGYSPRVATRPVQLQRTGLGVVVGLTVLALLVVTLWWWREAQLPPAALPGPSTEPAAVSSPIPDQDEL